MAVTDLSPSFLLFPPTTLSLHTVPLQQAPASAPWQTAHSGRQPPPSLGASPSSSPPLPREFSRATAAADAAHRTRRRVSGALAEKKKIETQSDMYPDEIQRACEVSEYESYEI